MIKNNELTINSRSDLPSRFLSLLIIAPIVGFFSYQWLFDIVTRDGFTSEDIGWLMMNCSGLFVLIVGSIFMRGHNNRNVLFIDVFFPIAFWGIYINVGSFIVDAGFHYLALLLALSLHLLGLMYIAFRVQIETKTLYLFGKYIAPMFGAKKDKYQDYAIRSVKSKGRTNYQLVMMGIYSLNMALWVCFAVALIWGGIAQDVPFYLVDASVEEKLSTKVVEYYGFDIGTFFLSTLHDWMNALFALVMVYYILTDYISPDKIGSTGTAVKNYVGHGARELI